MNLEDRFIFQNQNGYNHMGALLTDVILQAGLNYKTVVLPRVEYVLKEYPEASTLLKFDEIIQREGLNNMLKWNHPVKLNRMQNLISVLKKSQINECYDLKKFLSQSSNQSKILELKGIGPKTLDYLLKLLDFDVVPVDRHISSFVAMAQIEVSDYYKTKRIVEFAADFLKIPRLTLDYSIWNYMSRKGNGGIFREEFN